MLNSEHFHQKNFLEFYKKVPPENFINSRLKCEGHEG